MYRFVAGLALLAAAAAGGAAADQPTTVKLPVRAAAPPGRALAHPLLPDELDLTPGNAAPLWIRAGLAARNSGDRWSDERYAWSGETPLEKLPKKQVRALLAAHSAVFRLADQAARKERCDWDLPPLTVQSLADLPLDDVQSFRAAMNVLSIKTRLHLAEGELDEALHT